jgi:hypothetical protein
MPCTTLLTSNRYGENQNQNKFLPSLNPQRMKSNKVKFTLQYTKNNKYQRFHKSIWTMILSQMMRISSLILPLSQFPKTCVYQFKEVKRIQSQKIRNNNQMKYCMHQYPHLLYPLLRKSQKFRRRRQKQFLKMFNQIVSVRREQTEKLQWIWKSSM